MGRCWAKSVPFRPDSRSLKQPANILLFLEQIKWMGQCRNGGKQSDPSKWKMSRNHADPHFSFLTWTQQAAIFMVGGVGVGGSNLQIKTWFICNIWIFSLCHFNLNAMGYKRIYSQQKGNRQLLKHNFQTLWCYSHGKVKSVFPSFEPVDCGGRPAVTVSRPRP